MSAPVMRHTWGAIVVAVHRETMIILRSHSTLLISAPSVGMLHDESQVSGGFIHVHTRAQGRVTTKYTHTHAAIHTRTHTHTTKNRLGYVCTLRSRNVVVLFGGGGGGGRRRLCRMRFSCLLVSQPLDLCVNAPDLCVQNKKADTHGV